MERKGFRVKSLGFRVEEFRGVSGLQVIRGRVNLGAL